MLIGAYGDFWDADLVNWHPGSGPSKWQMLGHIGERLPGLRVTDFRRAHGVYVLYDHHGAYYAGLAQGAGGIGGRLKQHLSDGHASKWQRFSWFSFDAVSDRPGRSSSGLHEVVKRERPVPTSGKSTIQELEALIITLLGTRGQNKMKFEKAERWNQVSRYDADYYLRKLG